MFQPDQVDNSPQSQQFKKEGSPRSTPEQKAQRWQQYPPDLRVKLPAVKNLELADIRHAPLGTTLIDTRTGELVYPWDLMGEPGPEVQSILDVGVRENLDNGPQTFTQEYQAHKERNFTPEYQHMIEDAGTDIAEKIATLPYPVDTFIAIPARGERRIDETVDVILQDYAEQQEKPFIVIYHNDTHPADPAVREALEKVKKLPNVHVIDRQVSEEIGMGDIRGLLEDACGEAALRAGVEDPLLISTDGDVRGVNVKGTFAHFAESLKENPDLAIAYGSFELDQESLKTNPTYALIIKLSEVAKKILDGFDCIDRGPVGALTGVRMNSLFAVGGSPRVSYGEDKLLGNKIEAHIDKRNKVAVLIRDAAKDKQATCTGLLNALDNPVNPISGRTTQQLEEKVMEFSRSNQHAIPSELALDLKTWAQVAFPAMQEKIHINEGCVIVDGSKDLHNYETNNSRYASQESFFGNRGGISREIRAGLLGDKKIDFNEVSEEMSVRIEGWNDSIRAKGLDEEKEELLRKTLIDQLAVEIQQLPSQSGTARLRRTLSKLAI